MMTDFLRTFVAVKVEPSPVLQETMKDLKQKLAGEHVKWVAPNNLHLTLKFLGDTLPSQVDEIGEELNQAAKMFSAFTFRLNGLGFFKNQGMPRVLFVPVKEGEIVQQLAAEIDSRLAKLGFYAEKRPFKPHLTLARIKYLNNKKAFYEAVEKYRSAFMQTADINELVFYRSILKPHGPEYKSIAKIDLNSF
ncbi:2'-5' RNA ligase [Tangfeifania diversioriginum]|uniref:RNA 2',3'-cyclic phosphodiesterase n=1 Tax=Tangfeifania diversioriginum TaxID=1168035 RepID=A0A1M6MED0_9BACT|nr:RNA 2',3'-cyclic phosphodiesterase [Tangfeifania diversioriginum]SHJ81819.1 2'-5' RNA ligase [Tangfeifania diversioriginum]